MLTPMISCFIDLFVDLSPIFMILSVLPSARRSSTTGGIGLYILSCLFFAASLKDGSFFKKICTASLNSSSEGIGCDEDSSTVSVAGLLTLPFTTREWFLL